MTTDAGELQQWIGNTETTADFLTATPLLAMAATLDKAPPDTSDGSVLPPLWHWLYFLDPTPQAQLAADGHPRRGQFLPPIPFPRRMWAGSRLEFKAPLRIGQTVTRRSSIRDITLKKGRSGQLAFVEVEHRYQVALEEALTETQTIVYRQAGASTAKGDKVTATVDFSQRYRPDPSFLFRYSALTFNAHRIHYDRAYATGEEHYPGLVVHGPLVATLLLELLGSNYPDRAVREFQFRALAPLFDQDDFTVCGAAPDAGGRSLLWAENHNREKCMEASARLV